MWEVVRDTVETAGAGSGVTETPVHKFTNRTSLVEPIELVTRASLSVAALSLRDFTQYRCSGSNKLGTASTVISLLRTSHSLSPLLSSPLASTPRLRFSTDSQMKTSIKNQHCMSFFLCFFLTRDKTIDYWSITCISVHFEMQEK